MQEVRTTMMNDKLKPNCDKLKSSLPDLLLDPAALSPSVRASLDHHLLACTACREELTALQATMNLLDSWHAPEPSPYFQTRMQAKLRAEKEAAPEGFWERLRSRILFSTNVPMRAVGAAGLVMALVLGGSTGLYELHNASQPPQTQASATVRDLQSLDGNAQVFQQLSSLDTDDSDSGASPN